MVLLLVIYLMYRRWKKKEVFVVGDQRKVDNFMTKNFEISPESQRLYDTMVSARVDKNRLLKFLTMEDTFLGYEKDIVRNGAGTVREALDMSALISNTFSNYDTEYHEFHCRQIRNPTERINMLF